MSAPTQKFVLSVRLLNFGGYRVEVEATSLEEAIAKEKAAVEAKGWVVEKIAQRFNHQLSDTEIAALNGGDDT